jgi:hypothetical protein
VHDSESEFDGLTIWANYFDASVGFDTPGRFWVTGQYPENPNNTDQYSIWSGRIRWPYIDDLILENHDDVDHVFSITVSDTSGSTDKTVFQRDVTVASRDRTSYGTALPANKESRVDITLGSGESDSLVTTSAGASLRSGVTARAHSQGVVLYMPDVSLGFNEVGGDL